MSILGSIRPVCALLLLLPSCLPSCALITHSNDFDVAPAQEDARLCVACARSDLRHVPCPPTSPGNDVSEDLAFFALKRLDLGADASTFGPSYDVGLDVDCEAGNQHSCTSLAKDSPFPAGIDNGLAFGLLAPIESQIGGSLQAGIDAGFVAGTSGMVLVLDHWNGAPEDAAVGVRLFVAKFSGPAAQPSWSTADTWVVYSDRIDPAFVQDNLPDTAFKGTTAYVSNGMLVWDARGLDNASVSVFLQNGPATMQLGLTQMAFLGGLSETGITGGTLSAVLPNAASDFTMDFLTGCDPSKACGIARAFPALVSPFDRLPPTSDVPLPGDEPGSGCHAISVGLGMTFVRTGGIAGSLPNILPGTSSKCPRTYSCASP